jgi:hypothetical protein
MGAVPLLPIPVDPEAAIRHLVRVIGEGFHPDTLGCEYVAADGSPSFTSEEISAIDGAVVKALAALGEKVYSVAMEEMEALK